MVGSEHAQVGDPVVVIGQPGGPGFFESGLEHMAISAFHDAGTNRQGQGQGLWIVQTVQAVAQIAMAVADRGFCFGCPSASRCSDRVAITLATAPVLSRFCWVRRH